MPPPSSASPASPTAPASLEFRNWGYRHASRRHFAVRNLNLTIPPGQRVLLLGASGIGKSTILEGAAGLLGAGTDPVEPVSGEPVAVHRTVDDEGGTTEGAVLVDGVPVQRAIGRVGLVLQDPDSQAIFQRLGDNVAFGPENLHVPREDIWPRVHDSLRAVGLQGLQLHRSTAHLSGGQMQRLALAGALAMRPGVLLLDEPTANLDPNGVRQVVDAVRGVLDERHSTFVLVEHHAEPWIGMIDRVIVLGLERGNESDDPAGADGPDTAPVADYEGHPDREISHKRFRRTVIAADGTPDEVFRDRKLDLAGMGIWVPERYRHPGGAVGRIRVPGEPRYAADQGTGEALLTTDDLAIGHTGTAIAEHIHISLRAGQITALVGANGVGKSTLSLTLAGLLKPVSGKVVASGELIGDAGSADPYRWKSADLASRISYVFQNPEHQFARGSVLEEVMLAPLRTGMSMADARRRAYALLRRFSLDQYARVNPYTLSGGEKRRLTVASALAAAPRVLLLDEPTFGQDRRTWLQIVRLIGSLRAEGVSIVVVTHDRDLVTALGARVIEMIPRDADGEWSAPGPGGNASAPGVDGAIPVSAVNRRSEAPKQSSHSRYLASINPSFRLIGACLATLPMLLSLDVVSAGAALGLEVLLLMIVGFTPWRVVRSSWPVFIGAPGSALAVVLYGKTGGGTLWQWGLIHVTDRSVDLAMATLLRILAIGIPAIIAVLGIDATDLADSFSQVLRLPDRFVYGGLAGMRLFSVLQDDWAALTASRRSRGLGDENRVRAFFPQVFALLVLSIRRSTTLATAMQARGFGGKLPRSHARVSAVAVRDYGFLIICLAVPVAALVTAGVSGAFMFMGG